VSGPSKHGGESADADSLASSLREHRGQILEMARRSVLQTLRQPALVIPPVLFPLMLVAVNVGGLDAATDLPGFPTDSYLNFAIAVPFIQGALFAMINAGSALARDVETGFLKRLAMTPMQRAALLLGHLAGVMGVALLSALVYLVVGFAVGMDFPAGPAGLLALLALALLIALAFASLGALVGLRSGSAEAVQGFFPLFFVLLFLSSMSLPRPLIEQDWFRTIATYNPVSYLIEGVRSFFVTGWDGEALALGFGFAAVIAAAGVFGAAAALRTRLVRT
jgi:ABC-2 type transport system permease protein